MFLISLVSVVLIVIAMIKEQELLTAKQAELVPIRITHKKF